MPKEVNEEKSFEDFFNEAVDSEDGKLATPEGEATPEVTPEVITDGEAEPVVIEEVVTDPPVEVVIETTPTLEETVKELQDSNAALVHKMASWEGRIKKANERADLAESKLAKLEATTKETTVDSPSTEADGDSDDDTVLKEFESEFPDLVKPVQIMTKKYAAKTADERLEKVTPTVEKLEQEAKQSAEDKHYAPIDKAHPDWRKIYEAGDLQKWIDTKPPLQRRVLSEVVQNGSQEEIIDMFTDYKKSNNISTDKEPKNPGGDNSDLESIVVVKSQSAGPPAGAPDKNDFDAGWNEANLQK